MDSFPQSACEKSARSAATSPALPKMLCALSLQEISQRESLKGKVCASCHRFMPLGSFSTPKIQQVTFDAKSCNECRSYRKSKSPIVLERKVIVDEYKSKPCHDCGCNFPPECMSFYQARGERIYLLNSACKWIKIPLLREECDKHDVLCLNCRAKRIKTDGGPNRSTWNNRKNRLHRSALANGTLDEKTASEYVPVTIRNKKHVFSHNKHYV